MLDTFATKNGDKVWRLDPERILDAKASGRSAVELIAFLEAASGAEVPESIDQFLGELAARANALQGTSVRRV